MGVEMQERMDGERKMPMGDLVDRLRGIYAVPVNDGAGLLNGKDTFTRSFPMPPICKEAADEIERLRPVVAAAVAWVEARDVLREAYENRGREEVSDAFLDLMDTLAPTSRALRAAVDEMERGKGE
jgi:hypothetical protein